MANLDVNELREFVERILGGLWGKLMVMKGKFAMERKIGSQSKVFFLDDRPVTDLEEQDAFGHIHYSRALAKIVDSASGVESRTIGLFGAWGVGKTSIINELCKILRGESGGSDVGVRWNYQVVNLDTWQYSDGNFRREFLLDLAERFECKEEIEGRLTTSSEVRSKESPNYDRERILGISKQLVLFLVVWGAIFILTSLLFRIAGRFLGATEELEQQIKIILPILLTIPAVFIENIRSKLSFETRIVQTERPVHADEFKALFKTIVREKAKIGEGDRLLVVLDNLDRVDEEVVLQVLAAVKTFLDELRCIYILPCDDDGLKQHIRKSRSSEVTDFEMSDREATEYLRKFFNVALTIRDLLADDLVEYTQSQLARMELFELPVPTIESSSVPNQDEIKASNFTDVATVLRVAVAKDPRRIIHLANKVAANYLLGQQKREIDPRLFSNIASNLGFLAKLTVIEEQWPRFYELIIRHPPVLLRLHRYFVTLDDDDLPDILARELELEPTGNETPISREWEGGLRDFLQGTYHIQAKHITDFLYFKQRPMAERISDFYGLLDGARNGQLEVVQSILDDEKTDANVALDLLAEDVRRFADRNDIPTVTNIIRSILGVHGKVREAAERGREAAANSIAEQLSRAPFRSIHTDVDTALLLQTLSDCSKRREVNRVQIIETIINDADFVEAPDSAVSDFSCIARRCDLLDVRLAAIVKQTLSAMTGEEAHIASLREVAQAFRKECGERVRELLPQGIYTSNVALLQANDEKSKSALQFLSGHLEHFDESTQDEYGARLADLLSRVAEAPPPTYQLGMEALIKNGAEGVRPSRLPSLVKQLGQGFSSFANQSHKREVSAAYLGILPGLDEESQKVFHPHLVAAIHFGDRDLLDAITEAVANKAEAMWAADEVLEAVSAETSKHASARELRQRLFSTLDKLDLRPTIAEHAVTLLSDEEAALAALEDAHDVLPAEEFRSLLKEAIEKAHSLPDDQQTRVMGHLGNFKKRFTKEFKSDIVEILVNKWLNDTRIATRRSGATLWNSFKDEAAEEDVEKLYRRVLEEAAARVDDGTIVQEVYGVNVDLLIGDFQLLTSDLKEEATRLFVRMREQGREEPVRILGYRWLGDVPSEAFVSSTGPQELIEDIRQESEQDLRKEILSTLDKHRDSLGAEREAAIRDTLSDVEVDQLDEIGSRWLADSEGE